MYSIDPADSIKAVQIIKLRARFKEEVIIKLKKKVVKKAKKDCAGLVIWIDGSKLENSWVGAAVY